MILVVPSIPNGLARWTQTSALDSVDYVLAFDWSQRAGQWSLSLSSVAGSPIRVGMPLCAGWRLLRGCVDARRPPGELAVIDTTGKGDADPGFGDLGGRFALVYYDRAEMGR